MAQLLPKHLLRLQRWLLGVGKAGIWLAILPFFGLCWYAHPSADDFLQATAVRKYGHLGYLRYMYGWWSGRYTAVVGWSYFNPVSYGRLGLEYKLVCGLMLALLLVSLVVMLRGLLQGAGFAARQCWQMGAGAFLLLVYYLPSTAEGFYWLTSTFNYLLPMLLLFLAVGALAAMTHATTAARLYYHGLVAGLLFLTVGCNETVAVPVLFTVWAVAGVVSWEQKRLVGFPVALVVSAGCALAFLAPGNTMRLHGAPIGQPGLVASVQATFLFAGYCVLNWLGNGVVVVVTLLLVPAFARLARLPQLPLNRLTRHPWLLTLLVPAFLVAGLFPSFWVRTAPAPLRALNELYMCFLLCWMLAVYAWVAFAVGRAGGPVSLRLPGFARWALLAWLPFTFLTDYDNHLRSGGHRLSTNNSLLAYRDLLHGTAARYDAQLTARYQYLRNSPTLHPQVRALPEPCITLLYGDISPDSANWGNRAYADFFRKKTIVTRPVLLAR
ncbi:hypothetical protein MUN81_19405 [Hymenobacter sp. 5317J-9]|uniref:hypothetical protein n=1 Tax=Hymenobacter sp. 5317J-9 TaxID=2932250 RepID=UPI001FD64F7C|nr:hypothetical protein [Hymenobacter sp. 5317J-9]UOQ97391.1 hypothetical protein MUN81_19405 [Hymenobacter sp. 5317J-9]